MFGISRTVNNVQCLVISVSKQSEFLLFIFKWGGGGKISFRQPPTLWVRIRKLAETKQIAI